MKNILLIVAVLIFVSCNPIDSKSNTDDMKHKSELTYPDSSLLGKTYHFNKLNLLFKGFVGVTSGTFPAGRNLPYQISQIKSGNESYVSLLRVTKEGGSDFKLLDTLHFINYINEKFIFCYWNCTRNKKANGGTIVGLFLKSNEQTLTNPMKVWEVNLTKGVFIETTTSEIECENRGYEFLQQQDKQQNGL